MIVDELCRSQVVAFFVHLELRLPAYRVLC